MIEQTYSFPKISRLLKSHEFRHFVQYGKKVSDKSFLLSAKPNQYDHPRLGIVVSKKCSKKAVERNRIKRVIRESFRYHQHLLGGFDFLFIAKKPIIEQPQSAFRAELDKKWQKLNTLLDR